MFDLVYYRGCCHLNNRDHNINKGVRVAEVLDQHFVDQ